MKMFIERAFVQNDRTAYELSIAIMTLSYSATYHTVLQPIGVLALKKHELESEGGLLFGYGVAAFLGMLSLVCEAWVHSEC